MCGIYGTTIKYNDKQVEEKLKSTNFRGPDQLAWKAVPVANGQVTLGHNRLAIIDLDPRSNQPFSYENKVEIVFNGEIYNYKELRASLQSEGYVFKTSSDTEVICAAYLHYGNDCLNHFNGMFAFVIVDLEKQVLFGSRDRLGQKPFYYYHSGTDFEFASQLSPIKLYNPNLSISKKAILEYLKWGNIPDPICIFNEITKLRAGHYFEFDIKTGKLQDTKYWDIETNVSSPFLGSYEEASEELNSILKDAVDLRMYAEVPVGVFLSGGVDSSLIAATAVAGASNSVKTFSIKFNEKRFDESGFAQQVADHLKTDHHVIECDYRESLSLIDNFTDYFDEPFGDSSAIPQMLLAKHTRKKVTVALSGDAGDEIFLGYERYTHLKDRRAIFSIPYPMRKAMAGILKTLPNQRAKTIAKGFGFKTIEHFYVGLLTDIDLSWIDHDWSDEPIIDKEYLFHNDKNLYERISDYDLKTYLNSEINTKVDRASMAFSLEARSPLMDYRIVEFANKLPTDFKFQNDTKKRILKDILYTYVPKKIFDRPKAGFTVPFQEWFRGELKELVLSELDNDGLSSIPGLHVDKVAHKIKQHMNGSWNNYPLIWNLLVLKQWLNKYAVGLPTK
ncbi:asparagine synthase (glutamine-hydrolyzing) [Aggregatimonas sangjinii]|uniref:asparagine synthase (glutamine-hydrolyzing) n=1 Tax=Aggregatimonas sangjinii TaxID=2583587 RepID=A0A5B7SRM8_9FLAO|nr:asparagine synthase (glutamine-hydrolyzing) [Aggregatimonas sangjinii]QCW99657.1 asparagine synthase (glutamine-hydrolyzing) [Aggregatimonas sangjinii]